MRPTTLDLHIESLVLYGFPAVDQAAVGTAVQRELTRLFTERGAPPAWTQGGHLPHLHGGPFHPAPQPGADTLGAQIARSVYGGLTQ